MEKHNMKYKPKNINKDDISNFDPYGILREFLIFPDDENYQAPPETENERKNDDTSQSDDIIEIESTDVQMSESDNNNQTDASNNISSLRQNNSKKSLKKNFSRIIHGRRNKIHSEAVMNAVRKVERRRQLASNISPKDQNIKDEEVWRNELNELYEILENEADIRAKVVINHSKNGTTDNEDRAMKRNKFIRRNLTKSQVKLSCENFLIDIINRYFTDYLNNRRVPFDNFIFKYYRFDNRLIALRNSMKNNEYYTKVYTLIYNTRLIYGKLIPIVRLNNYIKNFVYTTCPYIVIHNTQKIARIYVRNYPNMNEQCNVFRNNSTSIKLEEEITDNEK
uniref:IE-1 n=1 Tax=Parastrongyloides trichosuri TaxID=131310 RepID=A0A0N4ZDH8_PARTI